MNLTQQRFYGFLNTPFLWQTKLMEIEQFIIRVNDISISQKIPDTLRLGNYVERLVSYQFSTDESIEVLKENVQIISNKTTLGEIDCLLMHDQRPIHLEIAYKFYLYDPNEGETFLDRWIGPNRRDSLNLKLKKLKEKQFPLLYSEHCQPLLEELNIPVETIKQKSLFKAQLFLPFNMNIDFTKLNKECVAGFYIHFDKLAQFTDAKFYIPKKLDWLIEPHPQVDWLNYSKTIEHLKEFHQKKSAPLCWMKKPNGELNKIFVTWW